jgi:hypothetical protein
MAKVVRCSWNGLLPLRWRGVRVLSAGGPAMASPHSERPEFGDAGCMHGHHGPMYRRHAHGAGGFLYSGRRVVGVRWLK